MFQAFNQDTLISRYIKRLLRTSYIPIIPIATKETYLIKDLYYIYDNVIIKCIETGKFHLTNRDALYPGLTVFPLNTLRPSYRKPGDPIVYGQTKLATYTVIKYYDPTDPQIHYSFHSNKMHYDSETHYHLGNYLRYLRDTKDLNLMPFYNCYANKVTSGITLSTSADDISQLSTYGEGETANTAVRHFKLKRSDNFSNFLIPVKFGQKYTIALDSDSPIQIMSIIYDPTLGMIVYKKGNYDSVYYTDLLKSDYTILQSSHFGKPFLFTIDHDPGNNPEDNALLYSQEKNLYLLIQTARDIKSSITVLEGDYIDSWKAFKFNVEFAKYFENNDFYKNLSLLQFNSGNSYAFSNRLIEYLLNNIIHKDDPLDGNIEYVQRLISTITSDPAKYLKNKTIGVWTQDIRPIILNYSIKQSKDNKLLRDIDGFLNKDIEYLLLKKGNINE